MRTLLLGLAAVTLVGSAAAQRRARLLAGFPSEGPDRGLRPATAH